MAQVISMNQTYARDSKVQLGAIAKSLDLGVFQRAVQRRLYNRMTDDADLEPFTIVDYGCANGTNSVRILQSMINLIRSDDQETPIRIYFSDLSSNDWKQLYANVQQLEDYDGVSLQFLIGSFYDQLMEDSTVDIAFCCSAMHWLSQTPCYLPEFAFDWTVPKNDDAVTGKKWKNQSRQDLRTFYKHRQAELKAGGELVLVTCGAQPNVSEMQNMPMYKNWNRIVCRALEASGLSFNSKEFVAPLVMRTREELEDEMPDDFSELEYWNYNEEFPFDLQDLDEPEGQKNFLNLMDRMFRTFLEPLYRAGLREHCDIHDKKTQNHYIDAIFSELKSEFLPSNWKAHREQNLIWKTVFYHIVTLEKE